MIHELFACVIDMSITASVVMIAVFIARGLMGRLPKKYSYLLWAIVAVRLLCPVGIPSSFSVFNLFGGDDMLSVELQRESAREWLAEWRNDGDGRRSGDGKSGDSAGQGQKEEGLGGLEESVKSPESAELVESMAQPGSAAESRAGMPEQPRKADSDAGEGNVQTRLGGMAGRMTLHWDRARVLTHCWEIL